MSLLRGQGAWARSHRMFLAKKKNSLRQPSVSEIESRPPADCVIFRSTEETTQLTKYCNRLISAAGIACNHKERLKALAQPRRFEKQFASASTASEVLIGTRFAGLASCKRCEVEQIVNVRHKCLGHRAELTEGQVEHKGDGHEPQKEKNLSSISTRNWPDMFAR
jgi:hypothetical protein